MERHHAHGALGVDAWVNETRNRDTRKVRIEKTISKLNGEHRRPCCFNLAACTDPELSRSGKLVEPDKAR